MDSERFDRLARACGRGTSRRGVLGLLAVPLVGTLATLLTAVDSAAAPTARRKGKGKGKRKRRKSCRRRANGTACPGKGGAGRVCCNGGCCAGCCGADGSCGACLAFVAGGGNAPLGGLAGADARCQAEADAEGADLPGTYKVWLSDSTASPRTRFRCTKASCSTEGYVRVDGEVFATDWDDLTDGAITVPITITARNQPHFPGLSNVWTHTATDGSAVASDDHCQDWTSNDNGHQGGQGNADSSDARWTDTGVSSGCMSPRFIYCFQQA